MAVIRENNWLGQQRLDVPQLRSIESSIRGDFDLLAGTIITGQQAIIVRGFALTSTTVSSPATSIQVVVANSILSNFYATESGSMFVVPADRANETLTSLNSKVIGSFTANATNYVGVDIRRLADATTSDILQFLNATTVLETSRTVPLARTLDYRFVISTTDFSSQANLCPIAIVVTDASNNITSVTDARNLLFRLGQGGSFASAEGSYGFPGGRHESTTTLDMSSGDKSITSLADWIKAAMTRVREIGGGEYWYSATADRNVTMIWDGTVFSNGENFEVVASNLHWQGIQFIFDNSTGYYNTVTDQTTDEPGLTDLVDGECVYVDLDRTQNATITAAKAVMSTLGPGAVPGARHIIAWMSNSLIYTRQSRYPVGSIPFDMIPATTAANGILRLSRDYLGNVVAGLSTLNTPVAITDRGGTITAVVASGHSGLIITADGVGHGVVATGGATNGRGVFGTGQGTGAGGYFVGGATGNGITVSGFTYGGDFAGGSAVRGIGSTVGVDGYGPTAAGAGIGVRGTGGIDGGDGVVGSSINDYGGNFTGFTAGVVAVGTAGPGIQATGSSGAEGILSTGTGAGAGGTFQGGATGNGLLGTAGATSGIGVEGVSTAGLGGKFTGFTGGISVVIGAGATNATAITATGKGTGEGGVFQGGVTNGDGIQSTGGGTGYGGIFTGGSGGGIGLHCDGVSNYAITVGEGHARFNGAEPVLTDAWDNAVTPINIIKAWGTTPLADITEAYADGFNVYGTFKWGYDGASVSIPYATVTLATAMANANFHVDCDFIGSLNAKLYVKSRTAAGGTGGRATIVFGATVMSTGGAVSDISALIGATHAITFSVVGRQ